MHKYLSAAAVFALLATSDAGRAKESPLVLAPSSPWVVNYADESCRLIRTFGEGDEQVRLEFRMFAPQRSFWLLVSGKPIAVARTGTVRIASRFDPDSRDTPHIALSGKLDETTPAVMFSTSFETKAVQEATLKAHKKDFKAYQRDERGFDAEREAQVNALEIAIGSGTRMTLKLGGMHAPMEVVRTCLDDLLDTWGVDAKTQKSLTRAAVPATYPGSWLRSTDYPAKMLTQGLNDTVNFRLTVDATGMPTACNVLTMESKPEFIKATCDKLMQRARFNPALDANGYPVVSIFVSTVIWTIG